MSASFKKPLSEPKGEVHALFPEQAAGPFQSPGVEETDIDFLRRFGPKGQPVDMRGYAAEPSEATRSALSAPDNFIADGATRRLIRHTIGRRRWPLLLAGAGLAGLALLLGMQALDRGLPGRVAGTVERPRGPAPAGDALVTATIAPAADPAAPAPLSQAAPAPLSQAAPAPAKAARAAPAPAPAQAPVPALSAAAT
ncbi:hypothetical protein ABS774_00875, partial [Methylobacterium oxalidis]